MILAPTERGPTGWWGCEDCADDLAPAERGPTGGWDCADDFGPDGAGPYRAFGQWGPCGDALRRVRTRAGICEFQRWVALWWKLNPRD